MSLLNYYSIGPVFATYRFNCIKHHSKKIRLLEIFIVNFCSILFTSNNLIVFMTYKDTLSRKLLFSNFQHRVKKRTGENFCYKVFACSLILKMIFFEILLARLILSHVGMFSLLQFVLTSCD